MACKGCSGSKNGKPNSVPKPKPPPTDPEKSGN